MMGRLTFLFAVCFAGMLLLLIAGCGKKSAPTPSTPGATVNMWLTNPDKSALFAKQNTALLFESSADKGTVITVDPATTYQTIDGFGFTLTGASAQVINKMGDADKDALLKDLFATDDTHIGISYLRLSIGASNLSSSNFTYDDIPAGTTDLNLDHFSIDKEKTDLIPILKKILAIAPSIKIIATPWTAPVWMKRDTRSADGFLGGTLNPLYYDVYGNYFAKYIQAMKAEGITIDAITPQNNPTDEGISPSMMMQAQDEGDFIKQSLGPKFKTAGINTKIIVYDGEADNTGYASNIINNAGTVGLVDGSAYQLFYESLNSLTTVHTGNPQKNIYFTMAYTSVSSGGNIAEDLLAHTKNVVIGATRNWCRNVLEFNLAADENFGPCNKADCASYLPAVTVKGSAITRNVSYYIIAHASKFVRPGAVRIASDSASTLPNVAFKNTDGSKVLIVLNSGSSQQAFSIKFQDQIATTTLNGGAVATYVWQ